MEFLLFYPLLSNVLLTASVTAQTGDSVLWLSHTSVNVQKDYERRMATLPSTAAGSRPFPGRMNKTLPSDPGISTGVKTGAAHQRHHLPAV